MTPQTKKYLIIGAIVLGLILLVVTLVVYFSGGDASIPGAAAVAAGTAAATAAVNRQKAQDQVDAATVSNTKAVGDAQATLDKEKADVAAVVATVAGESRDQKAKDGDKEFG